MRVLAWAFRGLLFFILFAFALNNQQPVTVRWFFGVEWTTPMVIVVLAALAMGCAIGVLAMVPSWWRHRRVAQRHAPPPAPKAAAEAPSTVVPSEFGPEPPRDGV